MNWMQQSVWHRQNVGYADIHHGEQRSLLGQERNWVLRCLPFRLLCISTRQSVGRCDGCTLTVAGSCFYDVDDVQRHVVRDCKVE